MPSYTCDLVVEGADDLATIRQEADNYGLTIERMVDSSGGREVTLAGDRDQLIRWYRTCYDPTLNHVAPWGDKVDPLAVSDDRVWETMQS